MSKIRTDFVTNSSSSSFIICFARIADEEKAQKILDKYDVSVLDAEGVNREKSWSGELGAEWCGAIIYGVDKILADHPDSKYIVVSDSNEAYYDEDDDYEPIYDYNFSIDGLIDEITEENGFADIDCSQGEGRDG